MEKPKIKKEEKSKKILPKINFPKDIKFLDKLNKINEVEYKKWKYKKILTEKAFGKSTLIIGLRCKDGIVLGGDRKVVRGGETDFENKVKIFAIKGKVPVIFAAAGLGGIIDDFLEMFIKTLKINIERGEITSLFSIKLLAEDLVAKVGARYGPRFGIASPIEFILGGLSELSKGEARLYQIGAPGFGERIRYCNLIGHGRSYARTIGKYLFPKDGKTGEIPFTCNEIVPRLATCIYWIGFKGEIDDYVGGDPQIVYIKDEKPEVIGGKYEKEKVLEKMNQLKEILKKINFKTQ
ncbi:MAG: hypothetical protein ACKKMO_01500 [Candidatus Nealsonbacteria bacterium]